MYCSSSSSIEKSILGKIDHLNLDDEGKIKMIIKQALKEIISESSSSCTKTRSTKQPFRGCQQCRKTCEELDIWNNSYMFGCDYWSSNHNRYVCKLCIAKEEGIDCQQCHKKIGDNFYGYPKEDNYSYGYPVSFHSKRKSGYFCQDCIETLSINNEQTIEKLFPGTKIIKVDWDSFLIQMTISYALDGSKLPDFDEIEERIASGKCDQDFKYTSIWK